MAKYRAVQTSFWNDIKVIEEFTADDNYMFLYLLTNEKANQIGCYELPIIKICRDTKLSKAKVIKILQKLEKELKVIVYDEATKEIFLRNWYKYNWLDSVKTKKCIEKEYNLIKSAKIKELIKPLYAPYMLQGEKEKEKEKKREEKEERNNGNSVSSSPTLTDILNYSSELGIDDKDYCERFYNHYEAVDWINGTGQKIKNWKLIFNSWIKKDNKKSNDIHQDGSTKGLQKL